MAQMGVGSRSGTGIYDAAMSGVMYLSGYAKAGKQAIRQWKTIIEQYFRNRSLIVLAVQLVDSRMPPTSLDLHLYEWLERLNIDRMIVATKSDKLSSLYTLTCCSGAKYSKTTYTTQLSVLLSLYPENAQFEK